MKIITLTTWKTSTQKISGFQIIFILFIFLFIYVIHVFLPRILQMPLISYKFDISLHQLHVEGDQSNELSLSFIGLVVQLLC